MIGVKLIDIDHMKQIYRLRRDEFWIATITAAVVVGVGVEQGVILAIVLSLLDHIRRHYDPHDSVVTRDDEGELTMAPTATGGALAPGLVVYRFGVGLFYANASRFSEEILALVDVPEPPRWLVLLADAIDDVDFTGGQTIVEVATALEERNVVFVVADVQDAVQPELDRFGLTEKIGADHIFPTLEAAVAAFDSGKRTP